MEIFYTDYWKNVVMKKNIEIYIHYKVISKYLATHPNYYEISSKLSKLGNIRRVEILTLNFSIKYGPKVVSKPNC